MSSFTFTQSILDLINNNDSSIVLVDENEDIALYNYNQETVEYENDIVKSVRGLILDKTSKTIIGATSSFTPELLPNEFDEKILMDEDQYYANQKCKILHSHEGCLIRVFSHNGKRYISTHKRLDAHKSVWGSATSFGLLFQDVLLDIFGTEDKVEEFLASLAEDKIHTFLLRNTAENRLVCFAPQPDEDKLHYVGSFDKNHFNLYPSFDDNISSKISTPLFDGNIGNVSDFVENSVDYKQQQGLIVFFENGTVVKVNNSEYLYYKNVVRNNEPSIIFRYIQVRMDRELNDSMHRLYPRLSNEFNLIEKQLFEIANHVLKSYIARFIKKTFSEVSKTQYKITRELHGWHIDDRDNNRVSIHKIREIIDRQPPQYICALINEYKNKNNN